MKTENKATIDAIASKVPASRITSLLPVLELAWDFRTAHLGVYTPGNPAKGQCLVTAMLVQDLYGGHIVRCKVDGATHFYNRLPDNTLIDLTAGQFNEPPKLGRGVNVSREKYPGGEKRYALLLDTIREMFDL